MMGYIILSRILELKSALLQLGILKQMTKRNNIPFSIFCSLFNAGSLEEMIEYLQLFRFRKKNKKKPENIAVYSHILMQK